MSSSVSVSGYEELKNTVTKYGNDQRIFVLFSGTKDAEGHSWWEENYQWRFIFCFKGVRIVLSLKNPCKKQWNHHYHPMAYLSNVRSEIDQGTQTNWIKIKQISLISSWKDPNCSFRTDPQLRLTNIPTLIEWGTVSLT